MSVYVCLLSNFLICFIAISILISPYLFSLFSIIITSLSDNIRTHEIASIFNFIIILTTTTFFSTNTNAVNAELRCVVVAEKRS